MINVNHMNINLSTTINGSIIYQYKQKCRSTFHQREAKRLIAVVAKMNMKKSCRDSRTDFKVDTDPSRILADLGKESGRSEPGIYQTFKSFTFLTLRSYILVI